jgi:hypothetical protein
MTPAIFLLLFVSSDVKLDDAQKAALTKKYPGTEIVAGCSGEFFGKKTDVVVAIFSNEESNIKVIWIGAKNALRELESIPQTGDNKTLELSCMPPAEAEAHQQTLAGNKDIHNFLKPPKGSGLLCYFTDAVSAKCWSTETKTGAIIEVGGWEI